MSFGNGLFAQYTMSNLTVFDCEGTLTDSEANANNSGWYSHNENYSFTICPTDAISIVLNFSFFETEPQNDYVIIYDGPDNTYPILSGPYSGINLPPQITSSGCITIVFVLIKLYSEKRYDSNTTISKNTMIFRQQIQM